MHKSFHLTKITRKEIRRLAIAVAALILFFGSCNYLLLYEAVHYDYSVKSIYMEQGKVGVVLLPTLYREEKYFKSPYEIAIGMYIEREISKEIDSIYLLSMIIQCGGSQREICRGSAQSLQKEKGMSYFKMNDKWVEGVQYWARIGQHDLPHEELTIACVLQINTTGGQKEYCLEFTAVPYVRVEKGHLISV